MLTEALKSLAVGALVLGLFFAAYYLAARYPYALIGLVVFLSTWAIGNIVRGLLKVVFRC